MGGYKLVARRSSLMPKKETDVGVHKRLSDKTTTTIATTTTTTNNNNTKSRLERHPTSAKKHH